MTVEPLFLTSTDFQGIYIVFQVHVIIKIIIIFFYLYNYSGMVPVIKYLNKKGFKFGLVSLI